jgi:hypothetical protein
MTTSGRTRIVPLAIAAIAAVWAVNLACGANPECDNQAFAGVCNYPAGAECVEFAGLSTADSMSADGGCVTRGGTWGDAGCPTAAEVGSCSIPPTATNIDITCSPKATIVAHYYSNAVPDAGFTTATAQASCAAVKGGVFTAN